MRLRANIRMVLAGVMGLGFALSVTGADPLFYVGTYTRGISKGIYAFRFTAQGQLHPLGLMAEATNPSFLAVHPNQKFLYAVNEISSPGKKGVGGVTAYAIEQGTGRLTLLNQQPSQGAGPCHLVVDATGKNLIVANYGSGSIAVLPIAEDGRLGEATAFIQHEGSSVNKQRQAGPHAHVIAIDPANRFVLTCDLGLDKVLVYRFDPSKGTLSANDPPAGLVSPGAGPRHLAFHPNGRYVYVNNEMGSTVTAFTWDGQRGSLSEFQTVSTLPQGFAGQSTTAEVEVHPSGKFLYCSNRGHDSIAVFAIDANTGKLTPVQHESTQGKTPRHFALDPTGAFLLAENQGSDSIVVFRVDTSTGRLTPAGQPVEVGSPVCIKFLGDKASGAGAK